MRRKQPPLVIVIAALCLGMGTVHQAGAQATAPKVDQLGQVHFPVSCAGEAQAKFHRAMALYHSFAMAEGKVAFDEIASLDPRCGMAHWGLAMVAARNPFGWPVSLKLQEGAEAIQKAKEVGAATPRERDYIAALEMLYKDHATVPHRQRALAYEQAMEKLAAAYSDDVEAKILYALAVSANHDLNDKTFARPLKAAGLLEPLFAAYPQHPGVAHYLIHSYDYPPIAPKGLEAAKRYAQIAPDAAHAQHMPSHIFTRVGGPGASRWPRTRRPSPPPKAIPFTFRTVGTTWSTPTYRWPMTSGPIRSEPKRGRSARWMTPRAARCSG